jgi:methyl-accepting chemotaxis protein
MKLETKLGLGTGGLILAMFLSAFTAHLRIQDATVLSNRIMMDRMPLILNVRDVRSHITGSLRALESDILFGMHEGSSSTYRAQRAEQMAQADRALTAIVAAEGNLDLKQDKERLARVAEALAQLHTLQDHVLRLSEANSAESTAEAYVLLQKEILPLSDSTITIIEQVVDSQTEQAAAEFDQLRQANRLTILTLWIATILGALAGGAVSLVLGRRIAGSVDQLARRADSIAAGDLTGRALQLGSNDQIGTLAEAMNGMQTALGGIIGTVAETAGSLTGSAASMRSASDQIHRRIDQQSQQTQQAATAMQEMSASIAEVSRHTQSAAETARSAAQTAREGGQIVKQMLGSMHSIASAVIETSSTVGLLGEDSKRISQIVTVIDEIARKTNLLALNAAIEAARAGDQGRGFAVVAGEVRRLAESTAQATGEIGNMIQEIQDRTKSAIASMAAGTGTVQEGVVTTTQAGEALERIIGMAERVDRMITQIAIAASQQAAAADQSSASLDSIHSLSHENLTEMATTAAGIETLRGTAVTLERQVDRFQVQSHHEHASRRAA